MDERKKANQYDQPFYLLFNKCQLFEIKIRIGY